MEVFSACLCVLINSQSPRRSECTRQYILARRGQANMRVSHLSPAARNRQENLGRLLHKRRLLLQRKHQISVPPCLRGQRSKFPASYTKSRQSCVGVLFHALQAQRNPAKICCGHRVTPYITEYLTIIRRHMSTARGRIMGKPSVKALRKRLSGRVADHLGSSRSTLRRLSRVNAGVAAWSRGAARATSASTASSQRSCPGLIAACACATVC